MTDKKATLTISNDGETPIELSLLTPTLGPDVFDVRTLGSKGYFTFDPVFTSTASCKSKITFIDGDKGVLLHRGFPIEQLAKESCYLEVCYILLYGEVLTAEEFDTFKTTVTRHTMIHDQIHPFAPWIPPRLAPDGSAMRRDRSVSRVLPRYAEHKQRTSPRDHRFPPAVKNANRGGDVLQIFSRPAVYLSTQQSLLRWQLPTHDVCYPMRRIRSEPGVGTRHGSHLDPAC